MQFSLPMTFNIMSLLLIVLYIYTIFGCEFFNEFRVDDYINFKDFNYAIMTLFKISTADDWENIMFNLMEINKFAFLYFISFYVIISFIMINLFVLILIEQFEEYHLNPNNPLNYFYNDLENFRKIWKKYSSEYKGIKIQHCNLINFFKELDKPLGDTLFN